MPPGFKSKRDPRRKISLSTPRNTHVNLQNTLTEITFHALIYNVSFINNKHIIYKYIQYYSM